jgi:hypothetical protein
MQTIARPPTIAKTARGARPLYTLHKSFNSIMAWDAKTTKMAVVAFEREKDAQLLGKMIETHYDRVRAWPDFTTLTFESGPTPLNQELTHLGVVQWSDLDEIRTFCAMYYFDMILIKSISNTRRIKGSVLHLSVPEETHIPYLERMLLLGQGGETSS